MAQPAARGRFAWRHWRILVVIGAALVLLLAAYLYWPAIDHKVTVTRATVYLVEGTMPTHWFGSPYINETAGYPFTSSPGASFKITVQLINFDFNETHVIVGANASSPFVLVGTSPSLPLYVGPEDTVQFNVTVDCPPNSGSYALELTINAL